ncbi:SMI1/KNR4 family protein [Ascidiimonas aurantiaca]|uniref:SMI1/KNR4 family protein n=1 Tax=Ascidiimonas aurantiaca TaxID=1685432 RepID=UPI0030ECBA92
MKYDELMQNESFKVERKDFIYSNQLNNITDELYLNFIKVHNGGYFYHNSMVLFGFSDQESQFNIIHMNELFKKYYQNLANGLHYFGQDIFGNAFAFENTKIIFFNIESAQKEVLADSFKEWLDLLYKDLDYYNGESLAYDLNDNDRKKLVKEKRLCPKYPFILGGDYSMINLVLKDYKENLSFNASIAKQVHNLSEGSQIKIVIDDK